jgi:cell division protein FtsI (penicillin-binding protein 3)
MVSREKRAIGPLLPIITAIVATIVLVRVLWIVSCSSTTEATYSDPIVSKQVVRGTVYDRNGNILAIETPYWSCAILVNETEDLRRTIETIAPILSLDPSTVYAAASQRSVYHLVKRRLSLEEHAAMLKVIKETGLKGVLLEKRYGRSYPQHYHASQVIGFTNTENHGIEGLELAFESQLFPYPVPGETITNGATITTTLDIQLQYLLDEQIVSIDRQHYPDSIVGIIMGADTGEVLAATTFPWYDPNLYQESEPQQRQNRIVTSMYEPGSVFKIFSLAAELQSGQGATEDPFFCDGSYTFTMDNGEEATINCVSAHGTITPETMIKYSCNGAVAHWALQTDDKAFRDILVDFGFTTAWNTGMPGTISGRLPKIENWSGRSKATISFGQEIAVTPLQLVTAATAIANGGNLMEPRIVNSIDGVPTSPPVATTQVIDHEVAQRILDGMEMATQSGGTATKAAVPGVRVGAKTGTAQVFDPTTGTYGSDNFLASTLAIVPIDDPRYIIYIGVSNPKGATIWGSNIAAPAIGSLIADMVRQGRIASGVMETITLDRP